LPLVRRLDNFTAALLLGLSQALLKASCFVSFSFCLSVPRKETTYATVRWYAEA
jgi:hypothetical protein